MRPPYRVFVDTDVVIAALLKPTGVSQALLEKHPQRQFILSTISKKEITRVADEHGIVEKNRRAIFKNFSGIIPLEEEVVQAHYAKYTSDPNDVHVIAGAAQSHSLFLATYNLRDFYRDLIRQELKIIVLPPKTLMQFFRLQ